MTRGKAVSRGQWNTALFLLEVGSRSLCCMKVIRGPAEIPSQGCAFFCARRKKGAPMGRLSFHNSQDLDASVDDRFSQDRYGFIVQTRDVHAAVADHIDRAIHTHLFHQLRRRADLAEHAAVLGNEPKAIRS